MLKSSCLFFLSVIAVCSSPLLMKTGAQAAKSDLAKAAQYFPATEFQDVEAYDSGVPDAWAEYLASLREAPLFSDGTADFAIRLTVSPAFPSGSVIRISESGDGGVIGVMKRFSYGTTKPITSTITVSKADLDRIKRFLTAADVWTLSNRQPVINTDGQALLLEVKRGHQYHAVYTGDGGRGPIAVIARLLDEIAHP